MAAHELSAQHHAVLVEFGLWACWKVVGLLLALVGLLAAIVRWWWPQPDAILPGAELDETRWPVFTGRLEEA